MTLIEWHGSVLAHYHHARYSNLDAFVLRARRVYTFSEALDESCCRGRHGACPYNSRYLFAAENEQA